MLNELKLNYRKTEVEVHVLLCGLPAICDYVPVNCSPEAGLHVSIPMYNNNKQKLM